MVDHNRIAGSQCFEQCSTSSETARVTAMRSVDGYVGTACVDQAGELHRQFHKLHRQFHIGVAGSGIGECRHLKTFPNPSPRR